MANYDTDFFAAKRDDELGSWLDGTSCNIGSQPYVAAKLEYDRRQNEKVIKAFYTFAEAISTLRESWKTKLLWLGGVALVVAFLANVFAGILLGVCSSK